MRSTGILPVGRAGILPGVEIVATPFSGRDARFTHRQDACVTA